ncbi:DAO domain-containing protein [Fusarium keratoplasticum]|nr:DAO domain-containing protein [Fusarium keratoplasticum]
MIFDKYTRLFGLDAANNIVRFALSHNNEINEATNFRSERLAVAAVFTQQKLDELKVLLDNFDAAFLDLSEGRKIIEGAVQKYSIKNAKGAFIGEAGDHVG